MRLKSIILIIPVAIMSASAAFAQPDSLQYVLDSTVLVSRRNISGLNGRASSLKMDAGLVTGLPRLLGSADPLRLAQYLPGVQTNAEYDNGLRIHGCDNAHNAISLDGIPVYGSTHLLGLFSVFNNAHFRTMEFETQALAPNRLGGELNMVPNNSLHEGVEGGFETGLFSSQGAISFPLGDRCEMGVAVRRSYLNLLYGRFLTIDEDRLKYSFGDMNLSFLWKVSEEDKLRVEAYFGDDRMNYDYSAMASDISAAWGNVLAGVDWEHNWGPDLCMTNKLYGTGFNVGVRLDQDIMSADIPSNIATIGYSGSLNLPDLKFGVDLMFHRAMPQWPCSGLIASVPQKEIQKAFESAIWSSASTTFGSGFCLDSFAKLYAYISPEGKFFWGVNPSFSISYDFNRFGILRFGAGTQTQFIFQTGVSNTGMPVEFYFLAGRHSDPQKSANLELSYDVNLFGDALSLSGKLYYKHLKNQVEYYGSLLEMIQKEYSLDNSIIIGKGNNYGATLMARKNSGIFTGWLSYTLGRSLRHFDSDVLKGTFPSSHERIHQLNAVGNLKTGKWEFGGTFVLASGTPFTAPKSYYLFGEQMVSENGEFNGARMPAYIRLDLSANWYIHSGPGMQNGFNLSIYNVLCRKNSMCCRMNVYHGEYGYASISLPMLFMPSIGYFHRF